MITEYFRSLEEAASYLRSYFGLSGSGRTITGDIWKWNVNTELGTFLGGNIVVNISEANHFLRVGDFVTLTQGNNYGFANNLDVRYQIGSLLYMETTDGYFIGLDAPESSWDTYNNSNEVRDTTEPPFSTAANYSHLLVSNSSNVIVLSDKVDMISSPNTVQLFPYFIGKKRIKGLYTSPELIKIGDSAGHYMCIARGMYIKE